MSIEILVFSFTIHLNISIHMNIRNSICNLKQQWKSEKDKQNKFHSSINLVYFLIYFIYFNALTPCSLLHRS